MEWDDKNIERMVEYVNIQLDKGRTMIDIEQQDFGVNERVIHKRLTRKGYKKVDRKYIKALDVKNIPPAPAHLKNNGVTKSNTKSNVNSFNDDEITAIKELIKNKDELLKILDLNKNNITKSNMKRNIRSKVNETKSFRVDTALYEAFRKKANKNNDKITDLINDFIEEYICK